jgi:putative copper resistance protein D
VVQVLGHLAGTLAVGLLLLAAFLLPAGGPDLTAQGLRAMRAAGRTAVVWLALVAVELLLTASDVLGVPLSALTDLAYLDSFVRVLSLGRALVLVVVLVAVLAVAARFTLTVGGAALCLVLSLAAWVPPILTGHASSAEDHELAVVSLAVHVVSMALWCGGLVALLLLALRDRGDVLIALRRFSALALWCVVALLASGVVAAWARLDSPADLLRTGWGRILLLKALLLLGLVCFGLVHRRRLAADPGEEHRSWFLRAGLLELLVMSAAVGLGVALSRTPQPGTLEPAGESVARRLLGFELPPAPTLERLLWGEARADVFFLAVSVLLVALYLTGVRALRRRGDRWPVGRTLSFVGAAVLLILATSSGLGSYSLVMFSAHMLQHMVLNMVVPIFFVLGAPVTLSLRALPAGPGPREWLLAFLHSRFVAVVSHPLVATAIFVGSFYVLYFTELFPVLMRSHWGHILMTTHFLLAGSLFFWVLIGVDPGPKRPPYVLRVVLLVVAIPMHAFFSIAVMSSTQVLGEAWFAELQRPYATDLLADQRLGGGIGWAMGEIPIVIVLIVLFLQWVRSDEQEARRLDRQAERAAAGDDRATDELADYNAYLAELARRDRNV